MQFCAVSGKIDSGNINSGGTQRAATRYVPMKSVTATQHHSHRLYRTAHYTVHSSFFQGGKQVEMGFGVSLWLKNQAVLSYTLNAAFMFPTGPGAGDKPPLSGALLEIL